MPKFKLKIFDRKDDPPQEHLHNIRVSRERMLEILKNLKLHLAELSDVNESFQQELSRLITSAEVSAHLFRDEALDIQLHPEIWSKTNRIGASKLVLDEKDLVDVPASGYKSLHKILTDKLKTLSRFNKSENKQIQQIDVALRALEEFQKDAKFIYIEYLRKETALALLTDLSKIEPSDEQKRLTQALIKLHDFSSESILTSIAALEFSKSMTKLCDDLILFSNQNNLSSDFAHLATQLRILAKREADNCYNHPKEMTTIDRIRAYAKATAASIGFVCGITAFIFAFIPLLQIASVPLAIVATLGMVPVLDKTLEVFRQLWYGRSPTKAQIIELGIIYPFMVLFIIGTHGLPTIASAFVGNTAPVIATLDNIGHILSTRVLAEIAGAVYLGRTILAGREIKEGSEPKTKKNIHKESIIPLKRGIQQFHISESKLEDKNIVNTRKNELLKELKSTKSKTGYLYKGKKSSDHVARIYFKDSKYKSIHSCKSGLFDEKISKNLDAAIKSYTKLPSDEPPANRLRALDLLSSELQNHPGKNTKQKLIELETWILSEKNTLMEISCEMLANGEDIENHRIYLTSR